MRLWSIAPELLDSKGLVACWRESLLALNVLQGKTKGYKNHPQLNRFKRAEDPIQSVCNYLHTLCDEADRRGYKFNRNKIPYKQSVIAKISVTVGQVDYEFNFLKNKVLHRTGKWKHNKYPSLESVNETFYLVDGDVEDWEKVKGNK